MFDCSKYNNIIMTATKNNAGFELRNLHGASGMFLFVLYLVKKTTTTPYKGNLSNYKQTKQSQTVVLYSHSFKWSW